MDAIFKVMPLNNCSLNRYFRSPGAEYLAGEDIDNKLKAELGWAIEAYMRFYQKKCNSKNSNFVCYNYAALIGSKGFQLEGA